jgi:hypothetical protein
MKLLYAGDEMRTSTFQQMCLLMLTKVKHLVLKLSEAYVVRFGHKCDAVWRHAFWTSAVYRLAQDEFDAVLYDI